MTATSAEVRFAAGGVTKVASYLHVTGSTYIGCFTYEDRAPILAIKDAHVEVTVTVPDPDRQVTGDDLAMGRVLAEAAARYVAELEQLATREPEPGADPAGRAA
jgi:hypothetical protein